MLLHIPKCTDHSLPCAPLPPRPPPGIIHPKMSVLKLGNSDLGFEDLERG